MSTASTFSGLQRNPSSANPGETHKPHVFPGAPPTPRFPNPPLTSYRYHAGLIFFIATFATVPLMFRAVSAIAYVTLAAPQKHTPPPCTATIVICAIHVSATVFMLFMSLSAPSAPTRNIFFHMAARALADAIAMTARVTQTDIVLPPFDAWLQGPTPTPHMYSMFEMASWLHSRATLLSMAVSTGAVSHSHIRVVWALECLVPVIAGSRFAPAPFSHLFFFAVLFFMVPHSLSLYYATVHSLSFAWKSHAKPITACILHAYAVILAVYQACHMMIVFLAITRYISAAEELFCVLVLSLLSSSIVPSVFAILVSSASLEMQQQRSHQYIVKDNNTMAQGLQHLVQEQCNVLATLSSEALMFPMLNAQKLAKSLASVRGKLQPMDLQTAALIQSAITHLQAASSDKMRGAAEEHASMGVSCCEVDLEKEIRQSMQEFVHTKHCSLHISTKLPRVGLPAVYADPICVRRIVARLVKQALKYTPVGRIVVSAAVEPCAGDVVQVDVTDTGIGIDATTLQKVMRTPSTASPIPYSTKTTMPVIRDLMSRQGGSMTVKSTPGVGTTVRVTLPLCDAPPAASSEGNRGHSGRCMQWSDRVLGCPRKKSFLASAPLWRPYSSHFGTKLLLCVGPGSTDVSEPLRHAPNMVVVCHASVEAFLRHLDSLHYLPDIVVLHKDSKCAEFFPTMFALVQAMFDSGSNPRYNHSDILVVMTGQRCASKGGGGAGASATTAADIAHAFASGANDYLLLPSDANALQRCIESHEGRNGHKRQCKEAPEWHAAGPSTSMVAYNAASRVPPPPPNAQPPSTTHAGPEEFPGMMGGARGVHVDTQFHTSRDSAWVYALQAAVKSGDSHELQTTTAVMVSFTLLHPQSRGGKAHWHSQLSSLEAWFTQCWETCASNGACILFGMASSVLLVPKEGPTSSSASMLTCSAALLRLAVGAPVAVSITAHRGRIRLEADWLWDHSVFSTMHLVPVGSTVRTLQSLLPSCPAGSILTTQACLQASQARLLFHIGLRPTEVAPGVIQLRPTDGKQPLRARLLKPEAEFVSAEIRQLQLSGEQMAYLAMLLADVLSSRLPDSEKTPESSPPCLDPACQDLMTQDALKQCQASHKQLLLLVQLTRHINSN